MSNTMQTITGKDCIFTKVFSGAETFEASYAAEKWCKDNGISYGRMCCNEPRGIINGDCDIQKWKNISLADHNLLDGVMISLDFRQGPVTVQLSFEPGNSGEVSTSHENHTHRN